MKDDSYWEEVRRAVGKGTWSILWGTSTRSLRRSLDRLRRTEEIPLFAGPLRVKITLEREDGTELLHAYLPRTVRFGDQVEIKFTAGEIS